MLNSYDAFLSKSSHILQDMRTIAILQRQRAPLNKILLIFEATESVYILPPMFTARVASALSYFIYQILEKIVFTPRKLLYTYIARLLYTVRDVLFSRVPRVCIFCEYLYAGGELKMTGRLDVSNYSHKTVKLHSQCARATAF